MKILVLGATGGTGRAVIDQAVGVGHDVTVLLHRRQPPLDTVTTLVGDARDRAITAAAIRGREAVIDCVGGKTPYRRTSLEADVVAAVVAGMQQHGVRRLLVTSSLGVGESIHQASPMVRLLVRTFLRGSTRDKTEMEAVVRNSGLDWTITRPAVLVDGVATGDLVVLGPKDQGRASTLTRSDLARFLVGQLGSDTHLGQTTTLSNR